MFPIRKSVSVDVPEVFTVLIEITSEGSTYFASGLFGNGGGIPNMQKGATFAFANEVKLSLMVKSCPSHFFQLAAAAVLE